MYNKLDPNDTLSRDQFEKMLQYSVKVVSRLKLLLASSEPLGIRTLIGILLEHGHHLKENKTAFEVRAEDFTDLIFTMLAQGFVF